MTDVRSVPGPPLIPSLIHHVGLPPQLPGRREPRPVMDRIEAALADRLLGATRTMRDTSTGSTSQQWESTRHTIQACKELNAGGKLSTTSLIPELRRLSQDELLVLHVTAQNAGLLVHRYHADRDLVTFEAFEASPQSEKVLAAEVALQWDFPGSAVAIPYSEFTKDAFQLNLADFLQQASIESVKRFAAHSTKAGSLAFESRDTVDPSLITQMLITLLEVNGHRVQCPIIRKRVHDEVFWADADIPWRRCAYWLVLRVALQRFLTQLHGGAVGRAHYKFLICVVLRDLIEEALGVAGLELVTFLQAKLARRLSKLEVERERASPAIRAAYDSNFAALENGFRSLLAKANARVSMAWNDFKKQNQRPILLLPRYALPHHMRLTLPNSEGYLRKVLSWQNYTDSEAQANNVYRQPRDFDASSATAGPFKLFANRYFTLVQLETDNATRCKTLPEEDMEVRCVDLAGNITKYLGHVGDAYDNNPAEKSIMLLTVMELWMMMDCLAGTMFELLLDYSPGIPSESLDVLQLLTSTDMARLQRIQNHLRYRYGRSGSTHRTIFDDPARGCFAERYFNESTDSVRLQELQQSIESAAGSARLRKEQQWLRLSSEYEQLQRTILHSRCTYITRDGGRNQHDEHCQKCYLESKRDGMKIKVHENPLPSDATQAKAVVFELSSPQTFRVYRNATWQILGVLARPKQSQSITPRLKLTEYSELKTFMDSTGEGIGLASSSKSWLRTHYLGVPLPVALDQVCLLNGLKLGYYDTKSGAWPGRETYRTTFAHHCPIYIPSDSPFSALQSLPAFAPDSDGPSSYEVLASQTKCPSKVNEHEFMAYQSLFSGKHQRWPSILSELGSSNLNFGTEATSMLVSQLATQAGPDSGEGTLRSAHACFQDLQFCTRLREQIAARLYTISANWREVNCMEMLLTLILRLCSIACEDAVAESGVLLEQARTITLQWIRQLRSDIQSSTTAETSRRCSQYAFRAALLCRRSFAILSTNEQHDESRMVLDSAAFQTFIESSITLQDNMPNEPASLPLFYRNMLVRDLKLVYRMRFVIRRSLQANPGSLHAAINKIWPQASGNVSRRFSSLSFVETSSWWIIVTVLGDLQSKVQTVSFNAIEGHLFVDGKPLGKLPAKDRDSVILTDLFGSQSLLTYPSSLHGMSYTLAFPVNGHQIHIGFRNKKLLVRACHGDSVLELIPRDVFGGPESFDIPGSLIQNCVHWLDIKTGRLEIRQRPDIWIAKRSNWILDFESRIAHRRKSMLIDPHSPPFRKIARIFERFEYPINLTVFQPERSSISIEIRRLELSFFINSNGLLECRQLRSEIDPDQDAGTWYGLHSHIILRDVENVRQRSVIVPMGPVTYTKNSFHVAVNIANNGTYARFPINDVLGRLDCPPEPALLYLKAHLHACSSFVLADPLTGRTGGEEAMHCLNSGYCQPWTPLNQGPLEMLLAIAKLTPRRDYYPRDARRMQQVFWDPELTSTIQLDDFRPVVEDIFKKSRLLSLFALNKSSQSPLELEYCSSHLARRGMLRRRLHRPPSFALKSDHVFQDLVYLPQGLCQDTQARQNVYESVSLLLAWTSDITTTSDLAGIVGNWPNITGLDHDFEALLLSKQLHLEPASEWGPIVNLCRQSGPEDMYRLIFMFATISYGEYVDMETVRVWIAFAVLEDLKTIIPPEWTTYLNFRFNEIPTVDYLLNLIGDCRDPYPGDERDVLEVAISHKMHKKLQNEQLRYEQMTEQHCKALVECILQQWPCPEPVDVELTEPILLDEPRAMSIIRLEWLRLFQNLELSSYVDQVQRVLDAHSAPDRMEIPKLTMASQEVLPTSHVDSDILASLEECIRKPGPARTTHSTAIRYNTGHDKPATVKKYSTASSLLQKENIPPSKRAPESSIQTPQHSSPEVQELELILGVIMKSQSMVRQRYGSDLKLSLQALQTVQGTSMQTKVGFSMSMDAPISDARKAAHQGFIELCAALNAGDTRARWLQSASLWPRFTPVTILEQLRSTSNGIFGTRMKEIIITYAMSLTRLQHLLRIDDASRRRQSQRLNDEITNAGHEVWSPLEYPDWLLLELDANILIRKDQVDVALATMYPVSKENSVLQMNMGQGKTSCIMPMAAAILANTENLVRLVVPQSLLLQTSQLLQARIGGLLGREVRHIPFSRKTSTEEGTIKQYFGLHKSMRAKSGVIVALPEHLLSFKLSGLQRLSDARINEAAQMIKTESHMQQWSRDILDESDITLAVRTQLVYPSGSQATVDGHPHRWEIAETLLKLVQGHLWNLQQWYPQSIEVINRPQGGFPLIFFLRRDVEISLIDCLVRDILSGQTSVLSHAHCTPSNRIAIKQLISSDDVPKRILERIDRIFCDKPVVKQSLYLVRGLLVHRILLLTLKKRWNVQYGLHPSRDPIAVPFHAKGVPSEQAEWGHPDIAILFTCLSFYYGGLDQIQLRQSLEHLVKSDDPSSEYDRWTHTTDTLPGFLRDWSAINVGDEVQLMEIWQHVRHKTVVIDYFLNHFVFPKQAKQFRLKLQASGWDVPLFSSAQRSTDGLGGAKQRSNALTTGFSGTNDNKTMLPLTIKQADLPGLLHTNAEVLTYLLQKRSRRYVLAADHRGKHIGESDLLKMLCRRNIRVLIDAGAQILEMDNLSLVQAWLKIDNEAPAALYFTAENKPYIYYRHGSKLPLAASPFADNLAECLVYLDEVHTRGTDLKLPPYTTGALTLGLGQTKDHTVQAAMRLRQLATTQAVVFFAPPEVHQSILDFCKKGPNELIDSSQVISWLLEQTCSGIEQMQPLYYSQGVDFCNRTQGALSNSAFITDVGQREAYLGVIRQKEQQTLEQLYKPVKKLKGSTAKVKYSHDTASFMTELNIRRKGFQDTGVAVRASALQEVEQEREVAFEVETIQERQNPVHYAPLRFPGLHRDIQRFAETGRLAAGSAGYEHALAALRRTNVGQKFAINPESSETNLFVSTEFARTVNMPSGTPNNSFLRPVNWILWSDLSKIALIVIPEEAELLIPLLREAKKTYLTHLISYAAPVTRKMLCFNNLDYYAIPSLPVSWTAPKWLTIELGIFAGRLYFEFDEYNDLREYLGLKRLGGQDREQITGTDDPSSPIEASTTDEPADFPDLASPADEHDRKLKSLTAKPLQFLQEWLAARRRGQDFTHTPMGHICQDKPLNATHAFFARDEKQDDAGPVIAGAGIGMPSQAVAEDGEGLDDVDWADDMVYGDEDGMDRQEAVGWSDLEDSSEESDDTSSVESESS